MPEAIQEVQRFKKNDHFSQTLGEVLGNYLELRKIRPSTASCYRRVINDYLGDWINEPIANIDARMVQTRHAALAKRVAHSTANLTMRVLRALFNFAINNDDTEGETITNPVSRLSRNRAWFRESRRQRIIPDGKLQQWYQAVLALKETTSRDFYYW